MIITVNNIPIYPIFYLLKGDSNIRAILALYGNNEKRKWKSYYKGLVFILVSLYSRAVAKAADEQGGIPRESR